MKSQFTLTDTIGALGKESETAIGNIKKQQKLIQKDITTSSYSLVASESHHIESNELYYKYLEPASGSINMDEVFRNDPAKFLALAKYNFYRGCHVCSDRYKK